MSAAKISTVILLAIRQERAAQAKKWGGDEHDDKHLRHDWVKFIRDHAARAVAVPTRPGVKPTENYRRQMIRVAALAIAALEVEFREDRGGK